MSIRKGHFGHGSGEATGRREEEEQAKAISASFTNSGGQGARQFDAEKEMAASSEVDKEKLLLEEKVTGSSYEQPKLPRVVSVCVWGACGVCGVCGVMCVVCVLRVVCVVCVVCLWGVLCMACVV